MKEPEVVDFYFINLKKALRIFFNSPNKNHVTFLDANVLLICLSV